MTTSTSLNREARSWGNGAPQAASHRANLDEEGPSGLTLKIKTKLESTRELGRISANEPTIYHGVVGAAWGLLLRCYSGQDDVRFGLSLNAETHAEAGEAASLDPPPLVEMHFRSEDNLFRCIEVARKSCENASSNCDVEATKAFDALGFADFSNTALCFHTSQRHARAPPVLSRQMCLHATLVRDHVQFTLTDFGSRVSDDHLRGIAGTFSKILNASLQSPTTILDELDYFGDVDTGKVFRWNSTVFNPVDYCVHDQVEEQAFSQPEHDAIYAWDGKLSYSELWDCSGRLARHLVSVGVGPEIRVPICFEKSVWTTVAMLAIMRAGGAFSLLDPGQPTSRLKALVAKLGAQTLLCSRRQQRELQGVAENVIPISSEVIDRLPDTSDGALPGSRPANIAYVHWTSGSTGEPKGVVIEHGAYCSAAKSHAPLFGFDTGVRVLQYASYAFDASIIETLTTLMVGGTVCVPNEDARVNDLPGAMNDMEVDWALFTPSVINFLRPANIPMLKTLVLGGEAMSMENINIWQNINLINAYGPAECSIVAVANPNVGQLREPSQIGYGIDVGCWVVNPENHDRPVPVGAVGELLIQGPTLARGYLSDPAKTQGAFIDSPSWCDRKERMYKTGDLVRQSPVDGSLFFVGRKDSQVKLHGQRIELGEIEHALAADKGVDLGIAALPKDGPCKNKLTAVILKPRHSSGAYHESQGLRLVNGADRDKAKSTVQAIRTRLARSLPPFMVPSVWLVTDSIPLLRSGKMDRKAILEWVSKLSPDNYAEWATERVSEEREATEMEQRIRLLWSHVLNLKPERIGLQQSFLAAGGDSISAMMLHNLAQKQGLKLAVQDILRARAIGDLACYAQKVDLGVKYDEKIEEEFDLSPIQMMYFELPRENAGHFNQSFFLRLTSRVEPAAIDQALKIIIDRHSMLRSRFRYSAEEEEWKQRVTREIAGSYLFKNHSCCAREETSSTISERQASLNPVVGPIIGGDLFNIQTGDQLLFLVVHHLVVDLVSWRVILEDLEEMLLNPGSSATTVDALPFQAWCRMQTVHAHGLSLASVLPNNELPVQSYDFWGRDAWPNTYGNKTSTGFELDAKTTSLISADSHKALRTDTVDMLVSAMIFTFAQTFRERPAPAIFNESHGREVWDSSIDLSRTVGWFTCMYPIYVAASDAQDFVGVLQRVKDYRRRVPANGRHYFASRMLTSKGAKKFKRHWPLEFTFNYLGVYQQLEREGSLLVPAKEMAGEGREAGGTADVGFNTPSFGLFETSAVIVQGKLRFSFVFNKNIQHQDRIAQWISSCQRTLELKGLELAQMAYEPTLSDFPLLPASYDGLRQLAREKLPSLGIADMANVEDVYPCTPMQHGILISAQRDTAHYAVHGIYKIKSCNGKAIDAQRLATSWQRLVDRHASLRTVFVESTSQDQALFDQVVLRNFQARVTFLDCRASEAMHLLTSRAPMTLRRHEPPHQLTICRTADGDVFCKLELSHTIIDGESWSIFFRELEQIYGGVDLSEQGPLYSDFVDYLQKQNAAASLGYWTSYLKEIELCSFPVLDGDHAAKSLRSLRVNFNEVKELQDFCSLHGVTAANVFHVAWALTLQCYTASKDVCFGYMTSSRDAPVPGIEGVVGYLVNMLICRVSFLPGKSLQSVVGQVQIDYLESLAHRQTALHEIFHALKMNESVFNTMLSYRRLPSATSEEPSAISFEESMPYYDPTEYAVSINIEASESTTAIDLDYWTDCVSDIQAANVASTFLQSLKNIMEHPEQDISSLDQVNEQHRDQILAWNQDTPKAINRCVQDVIKEQAQKRSSASAVCGWDASYTYTELDAVAGRLSRYLSRRGVGSGSLVCFCFDKSTFTIVAMLGVLRAGGVVVSLDSGHPQAALETRIEDTQSKVVLCSPSHAHKFTCLVPQVISVDAELLTSLPPSTGGLGTMVRPSDPCFVVYTSGSTGKPKGVVLEHRALVTSAHAHGTAVGFNPGMRCLQFASYTFDNHLEEIFTTLMHGGTVCVPSDHDRLYDLAGAINRLEANFIDLTPTVATYLDPSLVPTIKSIDFGGEALTKRALEIWGDKVEVSVMYGPSECAVNSTYRGNLRRSSDITSIGKAVGCLSWIVDPLDHNRLVPIGCEGELLLEGPIMAREYLNDPEKTANAFITNPLWARSSGPAQAPRRFYKTGDLVRYASDGSIIYLGRKDQQVKLHGQRIELGEIEHHIRDQLPSTWQFAVELITPGSANAPKALAVFLSPESADGVPGALSDDSPLTMSSSMKQTLQKLEAKLPNVLPTHMVPSIYIPLTKLPVGSSGKLDRRRLKDIAISLSDSQVISYRLASGSGRAPSSETECTLAALWESVLDVPAGSIGMDAQFFRMGGDSIAAIRLVTAARAKGIHLTVAKVFGQATLSQMCEGVQSAEATPEPVVPGPEPFQLLPSTVTRNQIASEAARLCNVDESAIEDIYPCTSLQEGVIAISEKEPGAYVGRNIYQLRSVDLEKFRESWHVVFAAEPVLRTRIVYTDTLGFLQVIVREPIVWSEDEPQRGSVLPAYNGARLTEFAIKKAGLGQASFVWTIHHALYDGWSLPLILKKVQTHYQSSVLPSSPGASYSRFIQYLSSLNSQESESYWASKLADMTAPHYPPLPTPTHQSLATSTLTRAVAFTRASHTEITSASLIRAAWALAVSAYSNSDDVVFAETITGRDAPVPSIMEMTGPTIATVPTRVNVGREMRVTDYLKSLQNAAAETLPHQYFGLQSIKRISRDTAKACDFQNLIAINGEMDEESEFWNLESGSARGTGFHTYALMVTFDILASEVRLEAQYDPDVLPQWQLERLLGHFGHSLSQLTLQDKAEVKLSELEPLAKEDRVTIGKWNQTIPKRTEKCIHEMVLAQVKAQPDAPAVCAWDAHLTYSDLDRSAATLAQLLVRNGVGAQSLVPIIFEKSSLVAIAQLAVLQTGAAFVPLDGDAPRARLLAIVDDLEAQLVLCSHHFRETGDAISSNAIVVDSDLITHSPQNVRLSASRPGDLAYIVYTSGSTGKPKGVMVQHSAFVSSALAHGPAMGISHSSRVLQFSSQVFDVSIMDIFTTLILGGCICIADEHTRLNDTAKAINEMKVNWAFLTPSFAQLLQPSDVLGLRTLALGGEAVTQGHAATWVDHTHLINAYGPSECSVLATVNPHISTVDDAATIGHAVGGRAWIVDRSNPNRLVPLGSIGELIMEGPILAQGYLNDYRKTSAAFLENLEWMRDFAGVDGLAGSRFYKTGDLVHYTADGKIAYVGRTDNQVKIHGQRLELSEVEHHLQLDPLVRHVLATVPASGPCEKRLTAVVSLKQSKHAKAELADLRFIPQDTAAPITSEIRSRLAERLQAYMLPAEWIVLEEVPLLPSGKLDRRHVLKWIEEMSDESYQGLHGHEPDVVDATETERSLQKIIAQVLGQLPNNVGLQQSFVQLGGDSILAIQLVSRCRAKGLGLTVQKILHSRSITELASKATLPQTAPAHTEQLDTAFALSPVQVFYFDCVGHDVNHYNQSLTLRLAKEQPLDDVRDAVSKLVNTHSMLRAGFEQENSGKWVQKIAADASKSLRFQAHAGVTTLQNIRRLVGNSQQSLDIRKGPVFSADVFKAQESGKQLLVLVAHHLVIDVVSWGIIMKDLEDLLSPNPSQLPPSISFQTWCKLQDEQAQKELSKAAFYPKDIPSADFAYWGLNDRSNVNGDILTKDFWLDPSTTNALLGPCHKALGTEPIDIFVGCILYSFRAAFADRDAMPVVFNEAHGRESWDASLDLSRTIGWFTTISPMYLPAEAAQENDLVQTISWIKDLRCRLPDNGRPSFAYRQLTEEGRKNVMGQDPMEILFNYLGQDLQFKKEESLLDVVDDISGPSDIGSQVPRMALFELSAIVSGGKVHFSVGYNRNMEHQPAVSTWVSGLESALLHAAKTLPKAPTEPTFANFPLLPMKYNGLARLRTKLSSVGVSSISALEDAYGCSPMQQGLLLSQMKAPDLYRYSAQFAVKSSASPRVDSRRLARAWRTVVQRHPSLRTVFVQSLCQDGQMGQAVVKDIAARIVFMQSDEGSDAFQLLSQQDPIDFSEPRPPHRLAICEAPGGRICCQLEMSHAICDGSSVPIIFRDLALAFDARLPSNGSGPLFSDYMSYLQSVSRDDAVRYWRGYLEGVEPCHFPALVDTKPPTSELRSHELELEPSPALQAFCTKNGATLSNFFQLVWSLVLRAYMGSNHVCFGYLAFGRDVPVAGIQDAVGLFANMLVCHVKLADDMSASQALQQIQSDFAQSVEFQTFSVAEIQHELGLAGRSLFNTAFSFQRRQKELSSPSSELSYDIREVEDPSEYDLTVNVETYDTSVKVNFSYWTGVMSAERASDVASTFKETMAAVLLTSGSNDSLTELDGCCGTGLQQVLDWNSAPLPKRDECVHDIIAQNAMSSPSAAAVCSWDRDMTYCELDNAANDFASRLIALGIGAQRVVPLCLEKSSLAVVAILAILKTGAAFVFLDPSHPQSRVEYILENVQTKLLLCSAKHRDKYASISSIEVLTIEEESNKEPCTDHRSTKNFDRTNPAYIIFTSGTTGVPKGTIVSHVAFSTGATEHARIMGMQASSRVLQFSNFVFDASIMEVLSTLLVGGCVCVPSDEERMSDVPGAIRRMEANWTLLTPSVVSFIKPEEVPSLKVLVTGGEAMKPGHIEKWQDCLSVINAYGPSETAVISNISVKVDHSGAVLDREPATIGHAVGSRSWIVNPSNHNRLMPVGCVGELVVEGHIVANGYLNEEERTAAAFISNPTWKRLIDGDGSQTTSMYKTGDLVKYNSNGSLRYIMRKDTQIKLRGLRIELGEIEHHVHQRLPPGTPVAVNVVEPPQQSKCIAAFFVPEEPLAPSENAARGLLAAMSDRTFEVASNLKAGLNGALPSYMIPSLYVPVTCMPTTASGKVDSRKLQQTIANLPAEEALIYRLETSSSGGSSPTTEMEQRLQKLWGSILNMSPETFSAEDNFFSRGADSVQAMRLVAAARADNIRLTTLDVFRKPTLSGMANASTLLDTSDEAGLQPFCMLSDFGQLDDVLDELATQCAVDKQQIMDAYPCSPLQEALLTLTIKQPGAYVAHNVFHLPEGVDMAHLKSCWEKALQDMDILRTQIVHTGSSKFIQAVLKKETIEWYTAGNPSEVNSKTVGLPESNGAALTRFTIVDNGDSANRFLVWSIHHALYDGWSIPLMLKRVEQIYFDEAPPPPSGSYAGFVKYLTDIDQETSDGFWKSRFEGLQALHYPRLPASSSDQGFSNQSIVRTFEIPAEGGPEGITLPTIIRATWALLLSAHTGSDDVIFGETLSGRDVSVDGIIDILGPTLTTVPTRIQVDSSVTISEYLQNVNTVASNAIPYQHAGIQHIRRLNADTAAACDFKNLLVIQMADAQGGEEDRLWNQKDTTVGMDFFTYPLVLECKASDTQLLFNVHFNDGVLSPWLVERLLFQFLNVFNGIRSSTNRRVQDISVASPQDLVLIHEWNNYSPKPVENCIHDLFLMQAEIHPEARAIDTWDGGFTYLELRTEALRLALYLKAQGVGPEVLVPICTDKSRWSIVAQLGVLMADGAMVPLDPAHPVSRHIEIIQDTHANLVLCSTEYAGRFTKTDVRVMTIDKEAMAKLRDPGDCKSPNCATPTNTAYCLYTSGSTGKPKGVVVEHKAFLTSSEGYTRAMRMEPSARVLNFASFTFDVGLMESLSPLTIGACVCIPSMEARVNDLSTAIDELQATWAFLTPSVANIVRPTKVPSLKVLVCGGEAMTEETVAKWSDRVELINGYGPTEASVIAVANSNVSHEKSSARIGKAHPTGFAFIADRENHDRLAPLGSAGELVLGGPILAREYLHQPDLTAEVFIDDASWVPEFVGENPGVPSRIYKTGDLVQYDADGSIIFLGRKDNQVKLHGQRMELEEIESKLEAHPRTRQAIVALPKSGPFMKRLVAVLSLEDIEPIDDILNAGNKCILIQGKKRFKDAQNLLREVQDSLEAQLPTYMVPRSWIVIETVPIMVSGKADRKTVARWVETMDDETYQSLKSARSTNDSDASTGLSEELRAIWATVFNRPVDQIDPASSFIAQGGDSLFAMAAIPQCRKAGIRLTLQEILQSRSLFALAKLVEAKGKLTRSLDSGQEVEKLDEAFDLSPVQQMYFQSSSGSSDFTVHGRFNQSQLLRLTRKTDPTTIQRAIEAIVQHHSMFRARFSRDGSGTWRQRIVKYAPTSYRFREHRLRNPHDAIPVLSESQTCLDIENGPLLAVDLLNIDGVGQGLSMIAHHLIIDVVSWNIVMQDLEDLLTSKVQALETPLSYQTWLNMQQRQASQRSISSLKEIMPFNVKRADLGFWDMTKRLNVYGDTKRQVFSVEQSLSRLAFGACNRAFNTKVDDILLTAVLRSFTQTFPSRSAPAIFTEGHGRESWGEIDLSRTTGWFTAVSPVTVAMESEKEEAIDTLKKMKDARRSVPDNGRPYFAHRYLTPDGKFRFSDHMPMEIIFNNTGRSRTERTDSLFDGLDIPASQVDTFRTSDVGPTTFRFALFEISVGAVNDQLEFSFIYNTRMDHQEGIRQWITACERAVVDLIRSLQDRQPQPTLCDYPLLPTTYSGLQKHVDETFPANNIKSIENVETIHVCAPTQEGLLLSQLRHPHSYQAYLITEMIFQDGTKPTVERLFQAWQQVVDRHQSLRTAFVFSVVKDRAFDAIVLKHVDTGAKVIHCDDDQVKSKMDEVTLVDVNLHRRPQLPQQLTVCKTPSGRTFLKIEANHAVIDGGSVSLLHRDVALAYQGLLPEAPKPLYSDYIQYINSSPLAEGLDWWKAYMRDVSRCHLPSLDGSPPDEKELKDAKMSFDGFADVQDFSKKSGLTVSNIMLTAWATVLRMYVKSDDISFGNITAGREADVPGIAEAVGAFLNMLCVRVIFAPQQTWKALCGKVQADYLESLPYQHCSLAKIQNELGFWGDSIFNTAVSIQNQISSRDAELWDAGIRFEPLYPHDPTEYDMTLNIRTAPGDEMVVIRYWSNSASHAKVHELLENFGKVLRAITANPTQTVAHFDKVGPDAVLAMPEPTPARAAKELTPKVDNEAIPAKPRSITNDLASTDGSTKQSSTLQVQPNVLRSIVKECVRETIDQMFKSGVLVGNKPREEDVPDLPSTEAPNHAEDEDFKAIWLKGQAKTQSRSQPEAAAKEPKGFVKKFLEKPKPSDLILKPLKTLWSSVLDTAEAAIRDEDSFFDLGGDSVRAMTLVGIAREAGFSVNVGDVFKSPSIADLALSIEEATREKATEDVTMINVRVDNETGVEKRDVKVYKRFSLLGTTNVEAFIQSRVCPRISVFRGGVVDMYPATDFQAFAIAGTFMEARWMLNYFWLDGRGPLDLPRLKKSIQQVVEAYEILRTVFVPCDDRFFQVVLRKLPPRLEVTETDQDLEEYGNELRAHDREIMPRLGEPLTQFSVVKRTGTDEHRIVMRLSHAQYDGVCIPKIISSLQAAYEHKEVSPAPPLVDYVTVASNAADKQRYEYWRNLLSGSSMTDIVYRNRPTYDVADTPVTLLKRTINIPSLTSFNITSATVMKAAWALTLAKMTSSTDIVFGNVVSGRNIALQGIEKIVGPCMNIVPVRLTFDKQLTALDLLRRVQNQQVASMPYESLGFREIIKHCTSWPQWSYFSSSVQHQNIAQEYPFSLGDIEYKVSGMGSQETLADLSLVSVPEGDDQYFITLDFTDRRSDLRVFAEEAFNMVCDLAAALARQPHAPTTAPKEIVNLPSRVVRALPAPAADATPAATLRGFSRREVFHATETLERGWRAVLGPAAGAAHAGAADAVDLDQAFHERGGDFVALAQLAAFLDAAGHAPVRVEDLMRRPTMGAQIALLCAQKRRTALHSSSTSTLETSEEEERAAAAGGTETPALRHSNSFWGSLARKMVTRKKSRRVMVE